MATNLQPNVFPPRYVSLRFCPTCGRDDRYVDLRLDGPHRGLDRRRCPGIVESFSYELAGTSNQAVDGIEGASS